MTNFGFFPLNLKKQQKPLERKKCQVSIFCNEICQAMLTKKIVNLDLHRNNRFSHHFQIKKKIIFAFKGNLIRLMINDI